MSKHRQAFLFLTVAVLISAVSCGNAPEAPDGEAPVAAVGTTIIQYRQIRCPAAHRANADRCLPIEQNSLRSRIYELAIENAATDLGITLNDHDLASVEEHVRSERPQNEAAANHLKAALRGVLRIHKGERLADVQEDLRAADVQPAELAEFIKFYPTAASAEEALAVDLVGSGERNVRAFYRRALLVPRIRAVLQERARARSISFADAESDMWRHAIAAEKIRVLDDRYRMPDFDDVLGVKEETVHVQR